MHSSSKRLKVLPPFFRGFFWEKRGGGGAEVGEVVAEYGTCKPLLHFQSYLVAILSVF